MKSILSIGANMPACRMTIKKDAKPLNDSKYFIFNS